MKMRFLLPLFAAAVVSAHAQTLAPLPEDGFVTLQQVVSDFSTQPDAAMQKYQGQRILVYGRVGQVTQSDDTNGDPLTVFLQIPNNTSADVKCVFGISSIPDSEQNAEIQIPDDEREAIAAHRGRDGNIQWQRPLFVEGQNVGIRGTVDNFVAGDLVLKDCLKVRPAKLREILRHNGIE